MMLSPIITTLSFGLRKKSAAKVGSGVKRRAETEARDRARAFIKRMGFGEALVAGRWLLCFRLGLDGGPLF